MKWKDTTIHSQSDTARETGVVECSAGDLRIVVHRHIEAPGRWLLTCEPTLYKHCHLKADELEAAKKEALILVQGKLVFLLKELKGK